MEDIRVQVVDYGQNRNLMMRYLCPNTDKQIARSTGTRNQTEAERAAAVWEKELRDGTYKAGSRMSWEDFRKKYESEAFPDLAESTQDRRTSTFNYVETAINPKRMSELTTARLSYFAKALRDGGMKPTTLSCHLGHLKAVLNWATTQGYLRAAPTIEMPKRAKGITRVMRGRPITTEEYERMLAKVAKIRKLQPKRWRNLLRGLWKSGLRLSEALQLSWDEGPEFGEFLLHIPPERRRGYVFGILGPNRKPLSTKRVGRYIGEIGKAAKVVTNKAENRFASAHDLRRSLGSRWSRVLKPLVLMELMRHKDISTTMAYYVDQSVEDTGDVLRQAIRNVCNTVGNNQANATKGEAAKVDTKSSGV